MNADASKVLAEALQQMDGIIAGIDSDLTEMSNKPMNRINALLIELGDAIKLSEINNNSQMCRVDSETIDAIISWLSVTFRHSPSNANENNSKEFEDKIHLLEYEKEQLVQQLSLFKEQKTQVDELENAISDLKGQLNISEQLLQDALRSRSLLETQNLHLKNEISKLKHIVGIQTNEAPQNNNSPSDAKVAFLKMTLLEKETEIGTLRLALAKLIQNTGYPLTSRDIYLLRGKSKSSESLTKKKEDAEANVSEKPPLVPRNIRVAGTQKDLNNYKASSVPQSPLFPRGRSSSPNWRSKSTNTDERNASEEVHYNTMPRLHGAQYSQKTNMVQEHDTTQKSAVPLPLSSQTSTNSFVRQPASMCQFATGNSKLTVASIERRRTAKDDPGDYPRFTQRSNPDLARILAVRSPSEQPVIKDSKAKGLKKIFEKMKRSNSSTQGFDAFNRGGFRATTGSRSGYLINHRRKLDINRPFVYWESDLIADWFAVIGLGMYSHNCGKWIRNGEHLMRLTTSELDKGLGMKNSIHRKKLKLALSCFNNECDNLTKAASELDYLWIAKWLDDIGLSQHKESFVESRVDGAVLHHLTIEDLIHLKVNTYLHYCSIRRGIQVLRSNFFNPHCLKKRISVSEQLITEWTSTEISLWTCSRVMEWLRSIDLPEYAPNLNGTGVTGALIIYEAAFNAEVLATLINIPANKTLLRRHLSLQFEKLIGHNVATEKRNFDGQPGSSQLLSTTKLKAYRGNHFSIVRRRGKNYLNYDDFVSPMLNADEDKAINEMDEEISTRSSVESNV